jgi:hypothetical protein
MHAHQSVCSPLLLYLSGSWFLSQITSSDHVLICFCLKKLMLKTVGCWDLRYPINAASTRVKFCFWLIVSVFYFRGCLSCSWTFPQVLGLLRDTYEQVMLWHDIALYFLFFFRICVLFIHEVPRLWFMLHLVLDSPFSMRHYYKLYNENGHKYW